VSRPALDPAPDLARELELRFAQDAELAKRLNDAHERLKRANDRQRWGFHADGMAALYGEHPAAVDFAFVENRSEVIREPDPLQEMQRVRWRIDHAFIDFQTISELRRQLAAEVGELMREFVSTLVAAEWVRARRSRSERNSSEDAIMHLSAHLWDVGPHPGYPTLMHSRPVC
jgi:hypothetical protein